MDEGQADQIIDLLTDLVDELRGMRSDFMEFTGGNTMKMVDIVREITGETGYSLQDVMGPLPYNLNDLHDRLIEIASSLAAIENGSR